jgi:BirA family transcriptional regulator, biotin operon repressor / biotin---[acetyl-CoA-carboxylase] ligase
MQILTDAPERTDEWTGFLISPGGVKNSFDSGFAGPAGWWRSHLAPGREVRLQEGPAAPELAFWPLIVVIADAASSQYDVLATASRDPDVPPAPVGALALTGAGFHGQRGRPWQAAAGNLHLSVSVPLDLPAATCGRALPALAAVAVTDAIARRCGPPSPVRIKWINDLYIAEAKVGGVVAATQVLGARITRLVLGIGLNVLVAPAVAPTIFVPAVTCLGAHPAFAAAAAAPGALLADLLAALARRIQELQGEGPGALIAAYRTRCHDVGRQVAIWPDGAPDTADPRELPPPPARGRVTSLDDDLALHLDHGTAPVEGGRLAYVEDANSR